VSSAASIRGIQSTLQTGGLNGACSRKVSLWMPSDTGQGGPRQKCTHHPQAQQGGSNEHRKTKLHYHVVGKTAIQDQGSGMEANKGATGTLEASLPKESTHQQIARRGNNNIRNKEFQAWGWPLPQTPKWLVTLGAPTDLSHNASTLSPKKTTTMINKENTHAHNASLDAKMILHLSCCKVQ